MGLTLIPFDSLDILSQLRHSNYIVIVDATVI